jgi:hypothetical protein
MRIKPGSPLEIYTAILWLHGDSLAIFTQIFSRSLFVHPTAAMRVTTLLLGFAANAVLAQRPADMSICDYYTTALLMDNTAANQYMLLTLVVNTALIGNYTTPNVGIAVSGVLSPGTYNGMSINLLPYFDGSLASTNAGGSSGMATNFLDDGGKKCKRAM